MKIYNKAIPVWSTEEQTEKINEILGWDNEHYTVDDIFNILPSKIKFNDRVGWLQISKFDFEWSSYELSKEGKVALIFHYALRHENIFDGFIKSLSFIKTHDVEILEE